jgi:hypothetical protein
MQALAAEFSGCAGKITLLFREKRFETVCFPEMVAAIRKAFKLLLWASVSKTSPLKSGSRMPERPGESEHRTTASFLFKPAALVENEFLFVLLEERLALADHNPSEFAKSGLFPTFEKDEVALKLGVKFIHSLHSAGIHRVNRLRSLVVKDCKFL